MPRGEAVLEKLLECIPKTRTPVQGRLFDCPGNSFRIVALSTNIAHGAGSLVEEVEMDKIPPLSDMPRNASLGCDSCDRSAYRAGVCT
jgi:hypothetical protein